MTGSDAQISAIELLTVASRTAFAARDKPGKDPFLLLTAARLERRANVTDLATPPPVTRAANSTPMATDPLKGDGLLGFEQLLAEARGCADKEAKLIAEAADVLRRTGPGPNPAWRWRGHVPGQARMVWRVKAPERGVARIGLAWAGQDSGSIELLTPKAPLAEVCDRGGAAVAFAADGGFHLIGVANPDRSSARFELSFGWNPG